MHVELGGDPGAAFDASLRIALTPDARFELRAEAPALDWGALARSLPPAIAPGASAPPVAGTFAARAVIEGPLHRPAAWHVEADVDLAGLHRGAAAAALDGPFTHSARLTPESARAVTVGPRNPDFVPVSALPPHVVRAVTASEDAGFFAHDGFDFHELSRTLADGERARPLGRGASTISQQVAKNLFLGRERTLARKAREALLTIALETSLRKQRILEIYLNIAEWGPGIFGIGEAARH